MSKLTKDEQEKLFKVLRVNACPNCGFTKVKDSTDDIFHVLSLNETDSGIELKTPYNYLRLLACSCPDCGYTMFFNLKTLGL